MCFSINCVVLSNRRVTYVIRAGVERTLLAYVLCSTPFFVFVEQDVETAQAEQSFPLWLLSWFLRLAACDAWLGACRDHGRAEELNSSSKSREAMLKDNSAVCRFYARGKRVVFTREESVSFSRERKA